MQNSCHKKPKLKYYTGKVSKASGFCPVPVYKKNRDSPSPCPSLKGGENILYPNYTRKFMEPYLY